MSSADVLNRKTRGLNSVREMMRKSCASLVGDNVTGKITVDIDADPLRILGADPGLKQVNRYLTWASATGKFTPEDLNHCLDIMQTTSIYQRSGLHFHLASLYLQVGENEQVMRLLSDAQGNTGSDSKEITWFAALMLFGRANGYALPLSDYTDLACLDYLESHLGDKNPVLHGDDNPVAVVGNAPGLELDFQSSTKLIYFNDYRKNPRLSGDPYIHVITPSWDIAQSTGGQHLLITGNNIFYRRSRVWRKFSHCPDYQSIGCFRRELWSRLYSQLKAPPSAGLLMVCTLAEQADPVRTSVSVDGFSNGVPLVNHEFDRVPPSARHNWDQESVLRAQAIEQIDRLNARG